LQDATRTLSALYGPDGRNMRCLPNLVLSLQRCSNLKVELLRVGTVKGNAQGKDCKT